MSINPSTSIDRFPPLAMARRGAGHLGGAMGPVHPA
jgi:hypothetical protein